MLRTHCPCSTKGRVPGAPPCLVGVETREVVSPTPLSINGEYLTAPSASAAAEKRIRPPRALCTFLAMKNITLHLAFVRSCSVISGFDESRLFLRRYCLSSLRPNLYQCHATPVVCFWLCLVERVFDSGSVRFVASAPRPQAHSTFLLSLSLSLSQSLAPARSSTEVRFVHKVIRLVVTQDERRNY